MALPAIYQSEIDAVDNTRSFSEVLNTTTYGQNEWSVSGWEVTGGSDEAIRHGASEALIEMGYRWYGPLTTTRPATLPVGGVTIAKTQHPFPFVNVFPSYGWGVVQDITTPTGDVVSDWLTINNLNDNRRKSGHAWGTIINSIEAESPTFWTDNPTYINYYDGGSIGFNCELAPADRTILVNRIAQNVFDAMNPATKQFSLDPEDGDKRPTDMVCDMCSDIMDAVHLLDGTTECRAGLYAYANHRDIPTNNHPYLIPQIALGFNDLGIGYPAMVSGWAAKTSGSVGLREYGEIPAWQSYRLETCDSPTESNYEGDGGFIASGADAITMESNYEWLRNLESCWYSIRYWKQASVDRVALREELVANQFNNDPAVLEFFTQFAKSFDNTDTAMLELCNLVDTMEVANRDQFRQILCVERQHAGYTRATTGTAEYYQFIERACRFSVGLGSLSFVSDNGVYRQIANSLLNDRLDIKYNQNPDWKTNPRVPDADDWAETVAYYTRWGSRPAFLSWDGETLDDLVIVDVVPQGQAALGGIDGQTTYYNSYETKETYIYQGPGTVDVGGVLTEYGEGMHMFVAGPVVKWTGGTMFAHSFPKARFDYSGAFMMYFPKVLEGRIDIKSDARFGCYDGHADSGDADRQWNSGGVYTRTTKLIPGPARFRINSRVSHYLNVMNPFFSSDLNKMLMTKTLAEREFPSLITT